MKGANTKKANNQQQVLPQATATKSGMQSAIALRQEPKSNRSAAAALTSAVASQKEDGREGSAFSKRDTHIHYTDGRSKDLGDDYLATDFIEDDNIVALTIYEYACHTTQTIAQAKSELKLNVIDFEERNDITPDFLTYKADNIREVINRVINGQQPIFIKISDRMHWVTIGVFLNRKNQDVLELVYINSAYGKRAEGLLTTKVTGLAYMADLITEITRTDLLGARDGQFKAEAIQLYLTPSQQLSNNCGVPVAFNIAALAAYWKRNADRDMDFIAFGNWMKDLPLNKILSLEDIQLRTKLFVGDIRSKFKAMRTIKASDKPNNASPYIDGLNTPAINMEIKAWDLRTIYRLKEDLERQIKERNAAIGNGDVNANLLAKIGQLPEQFVGMLFDIVEENRLITGEHLGDAYTEEELQAAYDMIRVIKEKGHKKGAGKGNSGKGGVGFSGQKKGASKSSGENKEEKKESENKKKQSKEEYFKELKKQRKKEDLEALYKMWKIISEYKVGKLSLEEVLGQVSFLSGGDGGISFNDNYDKETYTIRNRYGYRQRNQGRKENPNLEGRIDFEQLYRLNVILKSGIPLPEGIAQDLGVLEAKILYILSKELKTEPFLDDKKIQKILELGEQAGNANNLGVLSKFVQDNYTQVVLDKIKAEVRQFSNFVLDDRHSIYFFARKMVIIGEVCHELDQEIKGIEEFKELRKVFGALNKLRNGFIHFHSKILFNLTPNRIQRANQSFQEFIVLFKELLDGDIFLSCAQNPKKLGQCKKAINEVNHELLGNSKYKLQYQLETEVLRAKQVLDILESNEYKDIFLFYDQIVDNLSPELAKIMRDSKSSGNTSYLFKIEKMLNKELKLDDDAKNKFKSYLKALKSYIEKQNIKALKDQYVLATGDEENREFLNKVLRDELFEFDIADVKQIQGVLDSKFYPAKDIKRISGAIKSLIKNLNGVHDLKARYENTVKNQAEANAKKAFEKLKKEIKALYNEVGGIKPWIKELKKQVAKLNVASTQLEEIILLLEKGFNTCLLILSQQSEELDKLLALASTTNIVEQLNHITRKLDAVLDQLPDRNEVVETLYIGLFQQALSFLTNPNISMPKLSDINEVFVKLKEELQGLEPEDSGPLLNRFNFVISQENRQRIIQESEVIVLKGKPADKLNSLLKKINKEMKYLAAVEKNDELDELHKNAIMEHVVCVVGQYMRDLEEIKPLNQVFPSRTSQEAGTTSKIARSKGLAHEVLYFYPDTFLRNLRDNILPARLDFQAVYIIGRDSVSAISKTVIVYYRLGQAFMRLCLFDEAEKYFEDALKDIRDVPQLQGTPYSRTKMEQYKLQEMGIDVPTAIYINVTKLIFGIDNCELDIIANLVFLYIESGEMAKAQSLVDSLLHTIDIEKINRYKETLITLPLFQAVDKQNHEFIDILQKINPDLANVYKTIKQNIESTGAQFIVDIPDDKVFDQISTVISNIGHMLYKQKKLNEAVEIFKQALKISGTKENHAIISVGLAQCYKALKSMSLARTFVKSAIVHGDINTVFLAKIVLCEIDIEDGKLSLNDITNLENFYTKNKVDLKDKLGDRRSEYLLKFYLLKLRYLVGKSDYKLILEFHKKEKQTIESFDDAQRRKIYYCTCRALAALISPGNSNKNDQQILEIAQAYFDRASSIVIPNIGDTKWIAELPVEGLVTVHALNSMAIVNDVQLVERSSADNLAVAYSDCAVHHDNPGSEECIVYLKKARDLQEKYSFSTTTTLINLGCAYHSRAERFYGKEEYYQFFEDYRRCIECIERIQSLESAEGYHCLGSSYSRLGIIENKPEYLKKAMSYLRKAVQLAPDDKIYKETLSSCQKEHKAFEGKQRTILEAVNNFNKEGAVYFRNKNYTSAIEAFNQSISIQPTFESLYNRGRSYYESGDFIDAIKDYQEVLKINPQHAKTFCHLGLCYQQNGEHAKAKVHFKQALSIEPGLELAQNSLDKMKAAPVIQRWRKYVQHRREQSQELEHAIQVL